MLKIYICPNCFNFRMVSRKPDAICFHCGMPLELSDLEYAIYMKMTENERNDYKDSYKKRIKLYNEKIQKICPDNNERAFL